MWDTSLPGQSEWLPALDIPGPGRQRRLTVLVRLLLLVPQGIALWLLSIAAVVLTVIGWFAALVTARLPLFVARFLGAYLAYDTRVYAYAMLLVDRYPPFALHAPRYPVRIELRPGHLNRLAVFFRLILVIPALIIQSVATAGWWTAGFFCWLVVLIAGRTPRSLFESTSAIVRYRMRFQAYLMMLTSAYPKRLFGDQDEAGDAVSATRPLLLSGTGRLLLVVFLLVGALCHIGGGVGGGVGSSTDNQQPATRVSRELGTEPGTELSTEPGREAYVGTY